MTVTEILPLLHELNRAEKLYVMQFLISELAREESTLLQPGLAYPVWSPHDAHEAADTLLKALEAAPNDAA